MTTTQKPDALPVVAWLVTNLPSGEPSLCFEDERGDYGDEDHRPVFEALVLLSDAQAALQAKEADTADQVRAAILGATERAAKLCEDARDAAPVYRDEYDICNELAAAIRGDGRKT